MIRNPKMLAYKFYLILSAEINKGVPTNPRYFLENAIMDWNMRRGDRLEEWEIKQVTKKFVQLVCLMEENEAVKEAEEYLESVKEKVPTIYKWEVKDYVIQRSIVRE